MLTLTRKIQKIASNGVSYPLEVVSINVPDPTTSRAGTETPNFGALKAKGGVLPVQPYTRTDSQAGFWTFDYNMVGRPRRAGATWTNYYVVGHYQTMFIPSPTVINGMYADRRAEADNLARASLQAKLRNVQFDLPVFAGEWRETSRMLAYRIRKTALYIKDFRSSRDKTLAKLASLLSRNSTSSAERRQAIRDLNALFLEFQFGWKPLARDVEDAYTLVQKVLNPEVHVKKQAHQKFVETTYANTPITLSAGSLPVKRATVFKYDVWYGGLLKDPEAFDSLPDMLGADFGNLPLAAWELLRFSFLFDYVTNMQQFIGNLAASWLKLRPETVYRSSRITYAIHDFVGVPVPYTSADASYSNTHFSLGESREARYLNFTRTPVTWDDLLVHFQVEVPNLDQLMKAASLLYGAVDNRKFKVFY